MKKLFVKIRLIIAVIFLCALLVSIMFLRSGQISSDDIGFYGSFVIAIYAIIYGVEHLLDKRLNLGVFLVALGLMIIILNVFMMGQVVS